MSCQALVFSSILYTFYVPNNLKNFAEVGSTSNAKVVTTMPQWVDSPNNYLQNCVEMGRTSVNICSFEGKNQLFESKCYFHVKILS